MSYADVVSQMQAIETRLAQLGLTRPAQATSAASAAGFASALDGATGAASTTTTTATASADGATVAANGVTGDDVVQAALEYKGVPYVLGGESKSGIDCSGLVQATFQHLGVAVPRLVHEQQTIGQKVDSLKDAKPGDLIVLNGGDHIAIYLGHDTVIHAPYPGRTVSVQKAWFDDSDIVTIRRVVPATTDATTATAPAGGLLTSGSGLAPSTVARATSMLTTYGSDVGLYGYGSGSSDASGSASLSSLLASFGLSGTASPLAGSSAAQQIIAARTALLGAGA